MILRQFCARHGRTVLSRSSPNIRRTYATETILDSSQKSTSRNERPEQQISDRSNETASLSGGPLPSFSGRMKIVQDASDAWTETTTAVQTDLQTHMMQKLGVLPSEESTEKNVGHSISEDVASLPQKPKMRFKSAKKYVNHLTQVQSLSHVGSEVTDIYDPREILDTPPCVHEIDLPMLLANQTHLGHHTSLWNPSNSSYIFGVRDGIHIISLDTTYAYLQRAAKVVQEVARRGGIIVFVGTRKRQSEIVVRSARRAGAYHVFDRWVPGLLTNGQQILGNCAIKVVDVNDNEFENFKTALSESQHSVLKPDLVICLNPIENEVCLHECGIYSVPTIGVIDTDANPSWVTYPIPANDDSLRSVALIAGTLARAGEEGQRLRKESAKLGKATYSTKQAQELLQGLAEIQAMDVQQQAREEK